MDPKEKKEKIWLYEVKTEKQGSIIAGVRESNLEPFVKECDPTAKLTENNAHEWVLRYVIKKKGYHQNEIMSIDIKE